MVAHPLSITVIRSAAPATALGFQLRAGAVHAQACGDAGGAVFSRHWQTPGISGSISRHTFGLRLPF